jgi:hypothetical protein
MLCISVFSFLPESPRWLVHKGRHSDALRVLAQINTNDNETDPTVISLQKEIVDAIEQYKEAKGSMNFKEIIRMPGALRRLSLVFSCALATVAVGELATPTEFIVLLLTRR